MGVGINRKGPSSYANAKDKSDRATSEQVLDPRTRVILFKMIGRGLIQEVNGCVSTGKEVRGQIQSYQPSDVHPGECIPRACTRCFPFGAQDLQDIHPCVQGS